MASAETSNVAPDGHNRPRVAVLIPKAMRARIFPDSVQSALADFADPVMLSDETLANGGLAAALAGVPAVITGWQSPPLPAAALAPQGSIRMVSHAAGSVKPLGVLDALGSGHVRVSHAAPVIAYAVAEFTLAQMLAHLRRHRDFDAGFRSGKPWFDMREDYLGQLLGAQRVGIVGLGYVGRLVLDLLRPFGCEVCIFDPFVSEAEAARLGVTKLSLAQMFDSCSVISLHAANLPETEGMITAAHLAAFCDGGLLVNSARAGLIEPDAMLGELQRGRIFAALDTFDEEPLPEDHPLRAIPNVYLTPHCAGHTRESYVRQGLSAVEDVRLFFEGAVLKQEIPRDRAAMLA